LKPARRRIEIRALQQRYRVSERRALRVSEWPRSTHRHRSQAADQTALRIELRDLAASRPRFGYRRLTVLLRRKGWRVNHKRIYRLYRQEGLQVRIKRRKKLASGVRIKPPGASRVNERWTMDFVSDALADGRRIRVLTVIDSFTRECLVMKVAQSLPSAAVTAALEEIIAARGLPQAILDNGSEFTSNHFDAWAYLRGIEIDFIRPGKPIENAYIESFNGRLRDECLNSHWFDSLDDARRTLHDWRRDYNERRPHSALGDRSPSEFAAELLGPWPRSSLE
jgi:putative transposase